jgi:hypothetical protein
MFLATAAEIAQEGDWYAASICAQAMEVQGMLSKDLMAFERGVGFLDKVSISKLNGKGKSELFYQRGRLSWLKNDWAQAIKDFSDSLNECSNVLSLIYRLDCYVRLDELEKGRSDLAKLRALGVPEEFRLELLRSAAALVVKAGEVEGARSLVEELKGLKLGILNFAAQRDELCVNLLEFAAQEVGRKPSAAAKRASMLARIQKVASYFELKPNFFGLGLNLNRVFEAKEEKK